MKDTPISSRLPKKEKEHGYSVLVAPILGMENIILNKKQASSKDFGRFNPKEPLYGSNSYLQKTEQVKNAWHHRNA